MLNRTYTKVTNIYNTTETDDSVNFSKEAMKVVINLFNSSNFSAESQLDME